MYVQDTIVESAVENACVQRITMALSMTAEKEHMQVKDRCGKDFWLNARILHKKVYKLSWDNQFSRTPKQKAEIHMQVNNYNNYCQINYLLFILSIFLWLKIFICVSICVNISDLSPTFWLLLPFFVISGGVSVN